MGTQPFKQTESKTLFVYYLLDKVSGLFSMTDVLLRKDDGVRYAID
jgi:hypothetical protein